MTIEAPPSGGPIERYFAIMETVVAAGQGINLTEVASISGLPKPTAHRLLNSLVEIGALELSDSRAKLFLPGPRLWRMLQLGANPSQMARFCQVVSRELSEQLGETCFAVRYDGEKVESIAQEVSPAGYRFHVVPGDVLPFNASATAKVILASQDDATIDRHLSQPLEALTPYTKTSRIEIYADLHEARRTGYAICNREIDESVMAYAVPVSFGDRPAFHALGVTGPVVRMGQKPAEFYVEPLKRAAKRLVHMVGGREIL